MSLGLSPGEFWRATPRMLALIFRGQEKRLMREHNERAWLAFQSAVFVRIAKLSPSHLRKAQRTEAASPRAPQTPDQQLAIFKAMAEAQKALRKH